ncbi:MAG: threonine/serine exporter family protein [Clostridia bacterium]|nr:threonine/serine exporter family protein [Clostridia bacterium]
MDYKKLLDLAMNIGKEMLICGAEVSRVEDTISRICRAYNVIEVNVFTITSSIITTIKTHDEIYTQTKRIFDYKTNLDRLDKLNSLSREICTKKPGLDYILNRYENIIKDNGYSSMAMCGIYGIIALSLTVYFGGGITDGIVSGILGMLMYLLIKKSDYMGANITLVTIIIAFISGTLAVISVKSGFGNDLDSIVIGNIMLMIPGVAITNSIRDMISGDTMSGLLRFVESIIKAVAVATGFVIATVYLGGLIL